MTPARTAATTAKCRRSIAIIGAALVSRALPGRPRMAHVHEIGELRIARRHALHHRDLGRKAQHDVGGRPGVADEMAARAEAAFHIGEMRLELRSEERRVGKEWLNKGRYR